jgi:hypothetical protein
MEMEMEMEMEMSEKFFMSKLTPLIFKHKNRKPINTLLIRYIDDDRFAAKRRLVYDFFYSIFLRYKSDE